MFYQTIPNQRTFKTYGPELNFRGNENIKPRIQGLNLKKHYFPNFSDAKTTTILFKVVESSTVAWSPRMTQNKRREAKNVSVASP
jgi:hypothetical protein